MQFIILPLVALVLLVLGVTRALRPDWRRSSACLFLAALLYLVDHHQRIAFAKERAGQYRPRTGGFWKGTDGDLEQQSPPWDVLKAAPEE